MEAAGEKRDDYFDTLPPPSLREVLLLFNILKQYLLSIVRGKVGHSASQDHNNMFDICYYLVAISEFEVDFYDDEEDCVKLDARLSELVLGACRDDQLDFSSHHHSSLVTSAAQILRYDTDIDALRKLWPEYVQNLTSFGV